MCSCQPWWKTSFKSLMCKELCDIWQGLSASSHLTCLCFGEKLQFSALTGFIFKLRNSRDGEAASPAGALGRLSRTDRCLQL